MKRVVLTIFFLVIALLTIDVYADYGIPVTLPYKVVVTNKDGAKALSSDIVIPYGTEFEVKDEYRVEGETYGSTEYNNNYIAIKLSDVTLAEDNKIEYDINNSMAIPRKMVVYKEGAYFYKGPSIIYGKMDENIELPIGTIIDFDYMTDTWGLTEYNGVKGWVYVYTSDTISPYDMSSSLAYLYPKSHSYLYTIKEIELTEDVGSEKVVGTIPANEIVDIKYYKEFPDPHNESFFVEYGDVKGWYTYNYNLEVSNIETIKDFTNNDYKLFTYKDIVANTSIYKDGETITIPLNKECKLLGYYEYYETVIARVEYEGKTYFINNEWNQSDSNNLENGYTISTKAINFLYNPKVTAVEDINFIDIETKSPTGSIIKSDDSFDIIYTYTLSDGTFNVGNTFSYVNYNGKYGWIGYDYRDIKDDYEGLSFKDLDYVEINENDFISYNNDENISNSGNINQNNTLITETNSNNNENKGIIDNINGSPKISIMICIVGAICFAIVFIIILIKINKKNKE